MAALPKLAVEIQPLGNRVVILPQETEQVHASGLYIPDTAKGEKPQQGTVIAMGKGDIMNDKGQKVSNPHDFLKLGDTVLFGRYAGDEVKLKDKAGKDVEVKILHLDSILGVVKS